MALMHVNFFSDVLGYSTQMYVIIPQSAKRQIGMKDSEKSDFPVLYLLHGLSDDCTIWQRRTSIERYASEAGVAVIMPSALRSFYCDSSYGKYETFISTELPEICRGFFSGISSDRDRNYIAGLSMGGYGAFKIALAHPDRFCGAASLSGVMDLHKHGILENELMKTLSGAPYKESNDLRKLAKAVPDIYKQSLRLFQWCGTEDSLLTGNHEMRDLLSSEGFNLHYEESAGTHAWNCWDEKIQTVIKWLCHS